MKEKHQIHKTEFKSVCFQVYYLILKTKTNPVRYCNLHNLNISDNRIRADWPENVNSASFKGNTFKVS